MTMVLFQGHGKLSPKVKHKIVCSYFQFETPEHLAFLLFGCLAKKKKKKKGKHITIIVLSVEFVQF